MPHERIRAGAGLREFGYGFVENIKSDAYWFQSKWGRFFLEGDSRYAGFSSLTKKYNL